MRRQRSRRRHRWTNCPATTDIEEIKKFYSVANYDAKDDTTMHFTNENFEKEVLQMTHPVLVDVYADWCGPCRAVAPVVEELAIEMADVAKIGKVNCDEEAALADHLGVRSIPAFIVFKGGVEQERFTGVRSKDELRKVIEKYIDKAADTVA